MKLEIQRFGGRGASSIKTNRWLKEDFEYRTRMLGRLESDAKYFLGNGNGSERDLWAGSVEDQIKEMKDLYSTFTKEQKADLNITEKDINNYAKKMKALKKKK